jgi:hypothetical protein
LYDLRKIAASEIELSVKIQGQMDFDSGWEWGYWLNDVITARSAWNPHMETDLDSALQIYLELVCKPMGPVGDKVAAILLNYINVQRDLLIYGMVDGKVPDDIISRNGMGYVEGWDTWADIGCIFDSNTCIEPIRLVRKYRI